MGANINPQGERRVAVIAVHGVGYTEPCATAKHLADLLLGLGRLKLDKGVSGAGDPEHPPYREFTKQSVIVPLRGPYLDPAARKEAMARVASPNSKLQKAVHLFDERLGYLARAFAAGREAGPAVKEAVSSDTGKIAHEFMRSQLAEYVGEESGRAFDTTCMESERTKPGEAPARIHVYEAYWADLARPKNSFISFFMAFYQLLFHLSSLSRTAVYYAALEYLGLRRWRAASFLQAFASRMLVLPIPLLNLIMLLAGMTVITLSVPGDPLPWAVVIGCVLGLASVFASAFLRALPRNPWQWLALLVLAASLGGGVAYAFARPSAASGTVCKPPEDVKNPDLDHYRDLPTQQRARFVLAIEWWLVAGSLLVELFLKYNTVRHRAFLSGMVLLGLSLIVFLVFLHRTTDICHDVEQASFWTVQVDLAALVLCWALFLSSVALLWVCNLLCLYGKKARNLPEAQRGRARAALRTGRLTLSASASIFLLTTVFIWSGLFQYSSSKWSWYHSFKPEPPPIGHTLARPFTYLLPTPDRVKDWMSRVGYAAKEPNEFGDYVRGLFMIGVTSGLPFMLALSIPALIILVFMVVPSLLVSRDQFHLKPNRWIEAMGNWYSHGLDSTKLVTTLAWHAVFSVTLFFGALDFLYCNHLNEYFPESLAWVWKDLAPMTNSTMGMLSAAAGTLAVSGAALAAVIIKYGKTPLDIVLDVDHYLRTSPLSNTPRARITERYVSLLRHIANRNDEAGNPYYTSIVIGAHSLGALISADLLHFLAREGDPN